MSTWECWSSFTYSSLFIFCLINSSSTIVILVLSFSSNLLYHLCDFQGHIILNSFPFILYFIAFILLQIRDEVYIWDLIMSLPNNREYKQHRSQAFFCNLCWEASFLMQEFTLTRISFTNISRDASYHSLRLVIYILLTL